MATLVGEIAAAIAISQTLWAVSSFLAQAARDFWTAEMQYQTLHDDIRQCEAHGILVIEVLKQIQKQNPRPVDGAIIGKQLHKILRGTNEFSQWVQKNMFTGQDKSYKKLKKKLKAASGRVRKISSRLERQWKKLDRMTSHVSLHIQSGTFDAVLASQAGIAALHEEVQLVKQIVAKLSDNIGQNHQAPPPYNSDVSNPPSSSGDSEILHSATSSTLGYSSGEEEFDASNKYEAGDRDEGLGSDEHSDFERRFEDWKRRKAKAEAKQQEFELGRYAVMATTAGTAAWLGMKVIEALRSYR